MHIKLEFGECSNNAPVMTCHWCGKQKQPKFMADLHPFTDDDSHMSIVTCSIECRDSLLNLPKEKLEMALLAMADDIASDCGLRFNAEWLAFLDEMLAGWDKREGKHGV